ncbi:MAG: helix-turn-helix domain-containing protein [Thermoanaerobaculia bacterium]
MTGTSNRQPPWEEDQKREAASFGSWLRSQRQIREVPLREIADATKISIRYLEALEEDRFDVLPAPVFAKGFLREYAKFVGLDSDEVVNSYLTALQASESPESVQEDSLPARSDTDRRHSWILIVALVIALALIAFLIYWGGNQERRQEAPPAIAAPVLPPRPPQPEPEVEVEKAPLIVTMDFTADCWVEAAVDGQRRISELHVQGEAMRLEANQEVRLTLGNPAGVHVEVNGEPYDLSVRSGSIARDIVISLPEADSKDPAR